MTKKKSFKASALPEPLIKQHAMNYSMNPLAVLRELIQNASDSMKGIPTESRKIELAILSKTVAIPISDYHVVVRDYGGGMNDDEFEKWIGVLGFSTKEGDDSTIGQFGVGFYSTYAVSKKVTIVSKKKDDSYIAWDFLPQGIEFVKTPSSTLKKLLATDFENHPRSTRMRSEGTSVYIHIDFSKCSKCTDWLSPSRLTSKLKRDCSLLPTRVFVADYTDGKIGAIFDENQNDIKDDSLSLVDAPWELEGADRENASIKLIKYTLPLQSPGDLGPSWKSYSIEEDGGSVSAFLFMSRNSRRLTFDVYLKRMFVEQAADIKPIWAQNIYGHINLVASEIIEFQVPPARDKIIRNDAYFKAIKQVEKFLVDFFCFEGDKLLELVKENLSKASDSDRRSKAVLAILNKSTFFSVTEGLSDILGLLMRDIPDVFLEILANNDLEIVSDSIVEVLGDRSNSKSEIGNLSDFLEKMTQYVKDRNEELTDAQIATGKRPEWDPESSKLFFNNCVNYLPITVHYREKEQDGRWDIESMKLPLKSVFSLDQDTLYGIRVMTDGSSEDFFRMEPTVNTLVKPHTPHELLCLLLYAHYNDKCPKIEFVSTKKEIFKTLVGNIRSKWDPLVGVFDEILSGKNDRPLDGKSVVVDARGCDILNVPLFSHEEDGQRVLVINAYCPLMKNILASYTEALSNSDRENMSMLSEICHELYHHVIHSNISESDIYRHSHYIDTRNSLFEHYVQVLERYTNLKYSTGTE